MTNPNKYGEVVAVHVDIQNDFCPGGALAVNEGDHIVPIANEISRFVHEQGGLVVYTRDWHPRDNNKHFDDHGGPWPPHCIQYPGGDAITQSTEGAGLHLGLDIAAVDAIANKGTDGIDDGYSGAGAVIANSSLFGDLVADLPQHERTVGTAVELIARINASLGARTLVLVDGLATDYCVRATVLDLIESTDRAWADIAIVPEAIRAVDISPGDGDAALRAMYEAQAIALSVDTIRAGGIQIARREAIR